ncbi:monooxygenase [Bordetella ansorpii]|uniref:Monooxygenase n=1 Tax=Bordetella ansorpii TaxID=288768 RepID=A0A157NLQ0_9BORD|nr:NAD(P)/FAD-dependent oxidoreductase [Bordetella ansorpii]SAI22128.1 monooxygenase [Bordetella ansorpii]
MISVSSGLQALDARVADDLISIAWPGKRWMPPITHDGQPVEDVIIIGAGQAGLAAAFGLAQQGIFALLLDRAAEGYEGPWATTARMETLRSPKELTGPAMGVPSLTFRAWFIAQFGEAAWTALDKIPRLQWMAYLRWYRKATRARVANGAEVIALEPLDEHLVRLKVRDAADATIRTLLCRRVVLATGRDGLGGPTIPAFMRGVARARWAHSSDVMDYGQLRGQRVAVVGAGSSAMDSAATALEHGAASVDLLIRRADIPRINKSKASGVPGLTHGHHDLPDEWKWRIRQYINAQQVPPPHGSTLRVSRHANAFFNQDCAVTSVQEQPARADGTPGPLHISTTQGTFEADFLIVSTGFQIDWAQKPEFASIAPHVRLWSQRHTPAPGQDDAELSASPDLGPVFEFQERTPGACPGLSRIHCFCYPAALSFGTISGDIPAISDGARRLATGIASLFYREDIQHHWAVLQSYAEPELDGTEWTPADATQRVIRLAAVDSRS